MSNKSGVSDQIISLPKGGGALKGLGEKFSPDLHTGTGNFTVPIALPPGRNGFQPELSLVYSTGNGNGPFGLGWGLSIPGVSRQTSKGVPVYDDSRDTFVLSGAEDLVPLPSTTPVRGRSIRWAWGYNVYGALGDGTTTNNHSPVQMHDHAELVTLKALGNHALALASDETVRAWGYNSSGQLGDGTTTGRFTPVQVKDLNDPTGFLTDVKDIAAGNEHSLALKNDGTVWAWGDNKFGRLGDGTTNQHPMPVQVKGENGVGFLTDVEAVAAGKEQGFALRADGTVWAWGYNAYGQLGDGTRTDRSTPVRVSGLEDIVAISPGHGHCLALKADGTVWAWGVGFLGQLGDGTTALSTIPVRVHGLTDVVAISGGGAHSLALKSDGTVWAWGANSAAPLDGSGGGQLGDGTTTNRSIPARVWGLARVARIAAGGAHSLALDFEGRVWSWGANPFGQLGDGTTVDQLVPARIDGLGKVAEISAGTWFSLALAKRERKRGYRPRTEGLFARIYHHRNPDSDYWEVRSKDGLVSLYGQPGTAGNDPTTVADPENRTKVFAWKLSRTVDPFGNRIEYEYERDLGEDQLRHWDQLYLKRIRYAEYTDQGETKYLVSVSFEYEDLPERYGDDVPAKRRIYPFSDYRAGFEIRTRKRCKRIEIRTHAEEERLVRSYQLVYLDQKPGVEHLLPRNGVSLLSQIQVIGHDGERSEVLPPLEFGYTRFEPEKRDFVPLQRADLPARSLANPDTELVDLFGNGLPDIFETNGTVRYWRNLGDGKFDRPREMREAPAGLRLADPGVQLIDADGNGRPDLLVTTDGLSGYYPLRFGGLWDRRSFQRFEVAPSFNLEDPEVKLVDLDGDGVTDVVRSGSRLECFFNDVDGRHRGWTSEKTRWVERRAVEVFPNVNFSDPRVKLADMTGDGLQDIVLVHDGNVEYWPNLGHGNWGRRVSMRDCPRLPYGHDPKRILIGDVDGDGAADIVYVDDTKVTLWINKSGNGWSEPIVIRGTPSVSDTDAVRLADMMGIGISGVLWSADANGLSRANMHFLDFTGGTKPYLLNEMDNHMGAVTKVGYASSTRFYLDDQQKRPETRWKTPLPFPVQVVARVEVIDDISKGKLITEYRYHHGYWDGAERDFRGFGMVEQLDTETFIKDYNAPGLHGEETPFAKVEKNFYPPTLTKTWFHQGPIGDEFGEWKEGDRFDGEFWKEPWLADPDRPRRMLSRPQAMRNFLNQLPRRAKRDAFRALRGRVLRTELYALDGDKERKDRPYTVEEHLHGVCEVVDKNGQHELTCEPRPGDSPAAMGDELPPRIFFPHTLAQRTTQYERGSDPMTQFSFTEDYDEYGQPRRQIQIACPRGWRDFDTSVSKEYLATYSEARFAHRDDDDKYIVDRVATTMSYEIKTNEEVTVPQLKGAITSGSAARHVIGQTLNFYDRDASKPNNGAFLGLPFGQIGHYGALVRTESLVLTEDILHKAYKSGGTVLPPPEKPPYLVSGGSPTWTAEYPQEFRDRLPGLAGYTYQPGGTEYQRGYFAATERRRYDFHEDAKGRGRGLVKAKRDPLGRDVTITYDEPYHLLPKEVTDPVGLKTRADYDYRVLQPSEVTDPNGNRTRFTFTPLGLLKDTWVLGKPANNEGDRQRPSVRMEYDFLAFANRGQPISVRTIRQVYHDTEAEVPLPQRNETITTVEYSDGFGRLLQTRTQAEDIVFGEDPTFGNQVLPASQPHPDDAKDVVGQELPTGRRPRVVVSGWQTYDNKGRVVEKYEPFFSEGWEYRRPTEAQLGQKVTMFYDPRGRVIQTVNPDGSEQRVIHGLPADLANPDAFAPTPWEAYTYDANDNAGRTHPAGSVGYQNHRNTPTSAEVDALGRTVRTVERNGSNPATYWYVTRSTYDIRGNLLTLTDPLGRLAFEHVYDLANRALRTEQLDAGLRRLAVDAAGNAIERRDSKGALVLSAHDALNRPIRSWARDGTGQPLTLRERLVYGDSPDSGLSAAQATAGNLLGKPYKHYDEAGLLAFEAHDFKGNVLEKARQVISDSAILAVFDPPPSNWQMQAFRVDWQPPAGTTPETHAGNLLDLTVYRTSVAYDALNRVKTMRYPQDVGGARKELRPRYNRAGALERVELDGRSYVKRIAYNAKGQRTLIAYGNGLMTRYAYEPKTFRLARMRTERYRETRRRVNFALEANGASASASATYDGDTPPSAVINGDRKGSRFPGYWADDTRNAYPDWIRVDFDGPKTIDEIDVFTPQDDMLDGTAAPVDPTPELTFAKYGITDFEVQYWDGSAWVTVPGGNVTGNNRVWRKFTFPAVTTDRIRVLVHRAHPVMIEHPVGSYSRVAEIEAYETGTRINVALAASGATAQASSTLRPWPPRYAINSDKIVYHWKGQRPFDYPGWLQVDFEGSKTIDELDLFFHQEPPIVEPTEGVTSRYALTDFEVQYWTGSTWATVPGGAVIGNDKVLRRFTFPAVTTDRVRVLIRKAPVTGDIPMIMEIEAYGPETVAFEPQGEPLQDLAYEYDLVGNIVALHDRTPGSGVSPQPNQLDRAFTYDPLYRLLSATGRECDVSPPPPWNVEPRCADITHTRSYTETYQYDPAGNLRRLQHQANTGAFTRDIALAPNSNRLATIAIGERSYAYAYDPNGNLIQENASRHFEWDHSDRMRAYRTQAGNSEPSVHTHYLYDSGGQRVKKLVRKSGQVEVTVYIDGAFEHHREIRAGATQENNTLHVMDDQSRIALVRVGSPFPGDTTPAVKYHLGDHLGSSNVVIDDGGSWVNREEYTPYGETSFGSFARKRYRFTGKERDEESGLYYHGARYYAPWLGRWVNCDPAGMVDGTNLYGYVSENPLSLIDSNGTQGQPTKEEIAAQATLTGSEAICKAEPPSVCKAEPPSTTSYPSEGMEAGPEGEEGFKLHIWDETPGTWRERTDIYDQMEISWVTSPGDPGNVGSVAGLLVGKAIWGKKGITKKDSTDAAIVLGQKVSGALVSRAATQGTLTKGELPKIPHSSGRPLTVKDFKAGGKANEEMLNKGLNRIGVETVREKYVRDASGKLLEPRRRLDIIAKDPAGRGHPLEPTTPGQMSSPQKARQMQRDALHSVKSPQRTVRDDSGNLVPLGSDPSHFGGYAIMPPRDKLKIE